MTTEQIISKWRRHFLGILADVYATRKYQPSEMGMAMERHILCVNQLIQDVVNDVVANPPTQEPKTKQPLTKGK